jgi:hypothetical protein
MNLSRPAIIDRFRLRITDHSQVKLSQAELEALIMGFVDQLANLSPNAKQWIQVLCAAEIELLQEGYSLARLANDYLPLYHEIITAAVEDGLLILPDGLAEHLAISFLQIPVDGPNPNARPQYTLAKPENGVETKILSAIDSIMVWNYQHTEKFAISQNLLRKATGCNIPAIKKIISRQAVAIDQHFARIGLYQQPLNQRRDTRAIIAFIQAGL